jgi:hypothetical protein
MLKRWLFLILLVLNLLLFAWGYQHPWRESLSLAPLPPGVPTIQLLSETPTTSSTQAQAAGGMPLSATGSATAAGPQSIPQSAPSQVSTNDQEMGPADGVPAQQPEVVERRCVRLGPFDQKNVAAGLTEVLNKAGHRTELDMETRRQPSGFWVVIAPPKRQVDKLMVDLQTAGILDVWHFSTGPLAGTISLGLYSDRARAEERRATLARKGFPAEIRPRRLEVPVFWVRAHYVENDPAAKSALQQAYKKYPSLSFPSPPCGSAR